MRTQSRWAYSVPSCRLPYVFVPGNHYKGKCKDNVLPVHAMKAYMESGGIPPLLLNLSTGWR